MFALAGSAPAGTLPGAWGSLQLLEHLDLSHTEWQLPGGWPVSWGNMSSLRYLDLSESYYTTIISGMPRALQWRPVGTLRELTCSSTHCLC